jgi:hypothetical protein
MAEQPPDSGPTPATIAAQREWLVIAAASLPQVRASAAKWRDGLAALITLVTAGLVVSGPERAGDMPMAWQWGVAAGLVLGMLAVLVGLLTALTVAAGIPEQLTYEQFLQLGGTKAIFDSVEAAAGASRLRIARWWAVPGIVGILLAVGAWLVSPVESASPVQVTTATEVLCGELKSGDQGLVQLKLAGESAPAVIRYGDVVNLDVADKCEAARRPR